MASNTKYQVTGDDLRKVEALGFSVSGEQTTFLEFLGQHLPGLRLADFVEAIDNFLAPLTQSKLTKELHFFDQHPPMLMLQYETASETDKQKYLGLSRAFIRYPAELVVDHDFIQLPEEHRGKGKGKAIITACLNYYLECGVSRVRIYTGLEHGGLVWAKLFFAATDKKEVEAILEDAQASLTSGQYQAVQKIYELYYKKDPNGRKFPMLLWSRLPGMGRILQRNRWHGELDLTDRKTLANFNLFKDDAG